MTLRAGAPARFLKRVGKKRIGMAAPIFFYFAPPTFGFAHPEFSKHSRFTTQMNSSPIIQFGFWNDYFHEQYRFLLDNNG